MNLEILDKKIIIYLDVISKISAESKQSVWICGV
jgi:hypothetical protein